jgi:galactonate dehydratase
MAKQLARVLEPHQPFFIEEPLLPQQIPELEKLYAQTTIPIALGERLLTRQDVRPYFEAGCIDIIQPDIAHSGGISETKRIANMAETYDIAFAPHCPLVRRPRLPCIVHIELTLSSLYRVLLPSQPLSSSASTA